MSSFYLESKCLEFYILPGNPQPGFAFRALYNKAYDHYKSVWKRTFDRRAGLGVFDAAAFLRQSFVFIITYESEVVAQICGTFLNLDSEVTADLSYFENFRGLATDILKSRGSKNLMTLEYSSINPDFSPRKMQGLCFGEIITYLGYIHAMTFGVDATTGLPRRLSGTNDKVLRSGYTLVEPARTRCGLSVDVVLGFRDELIPHADPTTRNMIECLWEKRINLAGPIVKLENQKSDSLEGEVRYASR